MGSRVIGRNEKVGADGIADLLHDAAVCLPVQIIEGRTRDRLDSVQSRQRPTPIQHDNAPAYLGVLPARQYLPPNARNTRVGELKEHAVNDDLAVAVGGFAKVFHRRMLQPTDCVRSLKFLHLSKDVLQRSTRSNSQTAAHLSHRLQGRTNG